MQVTDRTGMQPAVRYSYDNAGRLMSMIQGPGSINCRGHLVTLCFAYNDADQQTMLAFPNGTGQTYSYDQANQIIGITYTHDSKTLGDLTYGYDLDGRRTTVGGTWARTGIPPTISSARYNADNELTRWGGKTLRYDGNGNLASDGTHTYKWNARNQLAQMAGGTAASLGYDAFGRRISTTEGAKITSYLLDGQNVIEQISGRGPQKASILEGPGVNQYYTYSFGGERSSILTDGLGSTLALAGNRGKLQTRYTYDPYGSTNRQGAASANPFQFAGMQNDGQTQYFDHARYFSPRLERFTSQDPIGCSSSNANLYRYVADDPINVTDPSGLTCVQLLRAADLATAANGFLLLAAFFAFLALFNKEFAILAVVAGLVGAYVAFLAADRNAQALRIPGC
jgi:RHS repeat-associated protein